MNRSEYPKVITTSEYWDCECEGGYIHHNSCTVCPTCNTIKEEGPDSRIDEVISQVLLCTISGGEL